MPSMDAIHETVMLSSYQSDRNFSAATDETMLQPFISLIQATIRNILSHTN